MTQPSVDKQRLFLAVCPEPAALLAIEQALGRAREAGQDARLRWVDREKLHITLRFLGSVGDDVPSRIEPVCRDVCARLAPFALTLAGAGAFPSPRRASVLWLGVREGASELISLAQAVNPALDVLGFAREERAFTPHLTVARCREPVRLTAAIATLSALYVSTPIIELLLVRSHLGHQTARYEVIARYPFGSG